MTLGWPEGSSRFLVADARLADAGDGAIAPATEARLRRLAPGAAILHAAYQGDLVGGAYPELRLVPPLDAMLGVVEVPEMAGHDPEEALALVEGADAVLSQGGGFAMEHHELWQRLRAWELVAERGIPLAFCAQRVGPWRAARERTMLARAYRAATVVGVREHASAGNTIELGAVPGRVVIGGDEACSGLPDVVAEGGEPRDLAARVVASAAPDAPCGKALWARLAEARRRCTANDEVVERLLTAAAARCA